MLLRLRFWIISALNVLLVCVSLTAAWVLRFEFTLPQRRVLLAALPLLVLMRLASMARFHLLHGYWRYTGVSDLSDIIQSVALGSAGFLIAERWVLGIKQFPVSIYCLEALLMVTALCSVRLFSRMLVEVIAGHSRTAPQNPILVVGAGEAGNALLNELFRSGYAVVGMVDDDPRKLGARIHGVRVLGKTNELPEFVRMLAVDEVLIAIPSATGRQMRRITALCEQSGVRFRTIPGMSELINGTITIDQLREVRIEDLLGRNPVHLNFDPVRDLLTDKVVLVTGAAGSIGSELCAQLVQYKPRQLLCVDQDESALFFLEQKMKHTDLSRASAYYVADIADRQRMKALIADNQVDCIFHAAAYKHVPMMETNISEAVRNNIFGLMSLMDVAEQCGCHDFLMISSDKAVNPTNVMGCTKRVCELIVAANPHAQMRRVSVRFGNVLGSQGSVIPVFQEQIRNQRRVTVTHPDVTRFFMTIPEAVSLVLQGFTIGEHGDILVLQMGHPIRIVDLARTLIRLSGKGEDDVEIVYTGLRKGEKLHEELLYASERASHTDCDKVTRISGTVMGWPTLQKHLGDLDGLIYSGSDSMLRMKLKEIVPEYAYTEHVKPDKGLVPSTFAGEESVLRAIEATAS